jgi:cell division septal protein FtsQ
MKTNISSEIKHLLLLIFTIILIGLLALTLEGSEINNIKYIDLQGNKYLSAEQYLNYAQLSDLLDDDLVTTAIIRDRLSKHPYIRNIDVIKEERGIVKVNIFERKMDAVLLQNSEKFLICETGEIIPLIHST